jgi:prevent-host-death family protein
LYNPAMTVMTVSEARAALPDLLDRVIAGEEVTITRHGQPVAVVVRPDALRARRADDALVSAARVRELLVEGRRAPLPSTRGLTQTRADELIGNVRAGRKRR